MPLRWETEYRLAYLDGRLALRAVGRESASGVIRRVQVDPNRCPILRMDVARRKTSVGSGPSSQGVRRRSRVAVPVCSAIQVFSPTRTPCSTLRYVWTTDRRGRKRGHPTTPYMPGVVRNIVMRVGAEHIGQWVAERRNIIADFECAFGESAQGRNRSIRLVH